MRDDLDAHLKCAWRGGCAKPDGRPTRCHSDAAWNRRCLAGLWLFSPLCRRSGMRVAVVRHYRHD